MTLPAINANLVRFLFPLFLVTGILHGIDQLTPLISQNQGAIGFLPYLLFSIALILCHSFNQGRMGMIAVSMMLAYLVIQERLQVPLNFGTTKLEFSILAFLMPVSCMTVYLFPNKRFFSKTGVAYLLLLSMFMGWAYLTVEHFSQNGMDHLWEGILFSIPQVSKLPFLAVLYSVIFVGISAIMVLTRREALDYAVYNCLLLSTVTFGFFQLSYISAVFFSLAGILLIYNIMSTSHSLAFIDQLTEIPSRRALENEMGHLGRNYSIAMLDVDHFKKFNDTHGHDTGDDVLRLVAKTLKSVEGKAKVYRYGGEEFTVLFKGKNADESFPFLDELREKVASYDMVVRNRSDRPKDDKLGTKKRGSNNTEKTVNVTISIGVADSSDIKHPKKVLKAADEALYKAKKSGRNCVVTS